MPRYHTLAFSTAATLIAVAGGCGGGRPIPVFRGLVPPDPREPGAATPQALLARVRSAVDQGDRNAFAACFARRNRRQSQGAALALVLFDDGLAGLDQRDAADRRFGPAAVDPIIGFLQLPKRTIDRSKLRDLLGGGTVVMDGEDRAVVQLAEYPDATSQLVRVNGAWLFDASQTIVNLHVSDANVENLIAANSALGRWHRDCVPLADTAGGVDAYVGQCDRRKQGYLESVRGVTR